MWVMAFIPSHNFETSSRTKVALNVNMLKSLKISLKSTSQIRKLYQHLENNKTSGIGKTRRGKPIKKKKGSSPPFHINLINNNSTTSAAWCQLLEQTSLVAKSKFRLVDDINALVVDSLRGVAARKDDARKKVNRDPKKGRRGDGFF